MIDLIDIPIYSIDVIVPTTANLKKRRRQMFDKKTRKTKQLMDECNTMSRDSFAIVNVLTHFVWLASLSRESLPQIICLLDSFLFE